MAQLVRLVRGRVARQPEGLVRCRQEGSPGPARPESESHAGCGLELEWTTRRLAGIGPWLLRGE